MQVFSAAFHDAHYRDDVTAKLLRKSSRHDSILPPGPSQIPEVSSHQSLHRPLSLTELAGVWFLAVSLSCGRNGDCSTSVQCAVSTSLGNSHPPCAYCPPLRDVATTLQCCAASPVVKTLFGYGTWWSSASTSSLSLGGDRVVAGDRWCQRGTVTVTVSPP